LGEPVQDWILHWTGPGKPTTHVGSTLKKIRIYQSVHIHYCL